MLSSAGLKAVIATLPAFQEEWQQWQRPGLVDSHWPLQSSQPAAISAARPVGLRPATASPWTFTSLHGSKRGTPHPSTEQEAPGEVLCHQPSSVPLSPLLPLPAPSPVPGAGEQMK